MVLMTDAEREYLIIYLIGYLLGRRTEATDIAKECCNPESLLRTSCVLPGCQKKSWLRRVSKVLSRHFKSCLHPLLQRHQQVMKLDRMRNKRRMGRFGENVRLAVRQSLSSIGTTLRGTRPSR